MQEKSHGADGDRDWDEAAPRPDALIESLRSFGYSPETALADLIDNSISAAARRISLEFHWEGADSYVAIVDDGDGMDEATLLEAMRPGSISPLTQRAPSDLGRFGLGLKTASFSQARELTVVSRRADESAVVVRRWDLDLVATTGQWRLLRSPSPAAKAYMDVISRKCGTAVVWTKCDRLVGDTSKHPERANDRFFRAVAAVEAHLGATFHRFLTRRPAASITINAKPVQAWDPILRHDATFALGPAEKIPYKGSIIQARAYVLPHRSKLTSEEQAIGAGIRGWTAQQGFYVYRNDRLLVAGDWLGAAGSKDEHTKLARIVIDFDSKLDLEWQIDVKKSTARPPGPVMEDLRRLAAATRRSAEEVYRHRGSIMPGGRAKTRPLITAWREFRDRSGDVSLRINREHPVVKDALGGSAPQKRVVERILRFIEETLPTSLIGIRLAETLDGEATPFESRPEELTGLLGHTLDALVAAGASRIQALDQLRFIEPFSNFPQMVESFRDGE